MNIDSDSLPTLSEAYRLLAACFCQPDLTALAEARVHERLAAALEPHVPGAADCARAMGEAASRATQDDLLIEYTRLFVGPQAVVAPPYGSVYLDPGGTVMGPSTVRVARSYRMAGVTPDPESGEPPDHISTELEFVHYLISLESRAHASGSGGEAAKLRDLRTAFLRDALCPWAGEFARRIREGSREVYFTRLADCFGQLVASGEQVRPSSFSVSGATARGDRR